MFIGEIDATIVETESGVLLSDRPEKAKQVGGLSSSSRGYQPKTVTPSSAPAASADQSKPSKPGLRAGTMVHHALFGPGTVLDVQGSGSKQKVRITFRNMGEKTLMVQYANLKIQS